MADKELYCKKLTAQRSLMMMQQAIGLGKSRVGSEQLVHGVFESVLVMPPGGCNCIYSASTRRTYNNGILINVELVENGICDQGN